MARSHMTINPGAIEGIIFGPQSTAQRKAQGRRIAKAWQNNINRVTGATDRSIDVETHGREVIVSADRSRDPRSAWSWLEWGTSKMRPRSPGRRAIQKGGAA